MNPPPLLLMASQALRKQLGDERYAAEVPAAVQQVVSSAFEATGWAVCEDISHAAGEGPATCGALIHPETQLAWHYCENPDCTKKRRFCIDCLEELCSDYPCDLCDTSGSWCEDCAEEQQDAHNDTCYEEHMNLCGCQSGDFNKSGDGHFMIEGHCRARVADGAQISCSEEGCEAVVCSSCISACDGHRVDEEWGGTRECGRKFCKMHRPRDWADPASSSSSGQYCGHCLGDPTDYEEAQDRKRCRRYVAEGSYGHPSHLYDEDTYNEMYEARGEPSGYNGW